MLRQRAYGRAMTVDAGRPHLLKNRVLLWLLDLGTNLTLLELPLLPLGLGRDFCG